ncbi:hypothetical protein FHR56_001545 [Xanthomonas sacchari]|nr:hypothetical protein [Xanthomonas sp. F10]
MLDQQAAGAPVHLQVQRGDDAVADQYRQRETGSAK